MNAEQKERMKYEIEVQKTRELKRIADALEAMVPPSPIKIKSPEDFYKLRNVIDKSSLIMPIDDAKE